MSVKRSSFRTPMRPFRSLLLAATLCSAIACKKAESSADSATASGGDSAAAKTADGDVSGQPQLALPVTAVRTDRAKPYVLQIEAGQARLREVTLGSLGEVNGQAWVEIASGLPAGADVLAGSVGALRDGTAVRLMSTASKAPANGNAAASESASR